MLDPNNLIDAEKLDDNDQPNYNKQIITMSTGEIIGNRIEKSSTEYNLGKISQSN